MRYDADHLLPDRDLLRRELARELLQQQQPVRPGVEHETALREMVDLCFRLDLHREEGVAGTAERFPQCRRGVGQHGGELQSLELAAGPQQLAGGDVAVHDALVRVGEDHAHGGGLDHRVEQQFALVEVQALAPQHLAEGVVGTGEGGQVGVRRRADTDAEVPVAQAHDAIAHRVYHAYPRARDPAGEPQEGRGADEHAGERGGPGWQPAGHNDRGARRKCGGERQRRGHAPRQRPVPPHGGCGRGASLLFSPSRSMRR